jgi:RNA polymerase-binding protein DksA
MTSSKNNQGRIPSSWRLHYDTLMDLRDRLIREREKDLSDMAHPVEHHITDFGDSATNETDREIALSRLSTEQDVLYEVEAALKRIEEGTYGICERTGKPISEARLKSVPWTRYCKDAAEDIEDATLHSDPSQSAQKNPTTTSKKRSDDSQ